MKTLLECDGIFLDELFIPAFRLKTGEVLCWTLPGPIDWEWEELLVRRLTGSHSESVRLFGKVFMVDPWTWSVKGFWQRLRSRFHRPLVVNKLAKEAGITKDQAGILAQRHGVSTKDRLWGISQNPRVLLALEIAWARRADVVVFSTSGCDPIGIRAIYHEIQAHLQHIAAIELCYPTWTQGRTVRICFPGATCLEITKQTPESSLVTPERM